MTYFTNEFIEFFQQLEQNNNKAWFDHNRKRYEDFVRKPMIALVEDVISTMKEYDDEFNPVAKKCLGRINRDIRFSKDKTPYNSHFFAHITKGTKEDPLPGIAFQFGAYDSGIMAGHYKPSKERLQKIRQNISGHISEFQRLKSEKDFTDKFGNIKGEAYKRIPPDLQSTYEKEPLIANKQFYYVSEKDATFALSNNLKDTIIDYWLAAKPLNDFFR